MLQNLQQAFAWRRLKVCHWGCSRSLDWDEIQFFPLCKFDILRHTENCTQLQTVSRETETNLTHSNTLFQQRACAATPGYFAWDQGTCLATECPRNAGDVVPQATRALSLGCPVHGESTSTLNAALEQIQCFVRTVAKVKTNSLRSAPAERMALGQYPALCTSNWSNCWVVHLLYLPICWFVDIDPICPEVDHVNF